MTNKVKTKKILFYVHFNKYNKVDDYVIYQLQQMKPIFDTIILLSNSRVSVGDEKKLAGLYDKFIQRKNKGFDFAAWRDGMNDFGWDKIAKYDELTVMNDTCFGPVYDFELIYNKMQSRKVDFWGMTTNVALKDLVADSSGKHIFAPMHIQSYYTTFNKDVVKSDVFKEFWMNVKDFDDVLDVIINYEIKLTELLSKNGFTYDSFFNAKKYWKKSVLTRNEVDISAMSSGDMKKYNPGYTCVRPLWLLKTAKGYPFIKTKSVAMASSQLGELRSYLIRNTDYPVRLIDTYVGARYSELVKAKDDQIEAIMKSRTYTIGNMIATPLRRIKGFVK